MVYVVVYDHALKAPALEQLLDHGHRTRGEQHAQAHVFVPVPLKVARRRVGKRHAALGGDYVREVQAGELADDKRVDLVEGRDVHRYVAAPVEVVYRVGHYRFSMAWRM